MVYRYFYRIVIEHGNGDPSEILEQLRNETMTNRLYRDVLRWALASDMDGARVGWVRASVYRAVGAFEAMPVVGETRRWCCGEWVTVEQTLSEESLQLVAGITWLPTFDDDGTRHIIKRFERWPAVWSDPFMRCGHRVLECCEEEVLPDA